MQVQKWRVSKTMAPLEKALTPQLALPFSEGSRSLCIILAKRRVFHNCQFTIRGFFPNRLLLQNQAAIPRQLPNWCCRTSLLMFSGRFIRFTTIWHLGLTPMWHQLLSNLNISWHQLWNWVKGKVQITFINNIKTRNEKATKNPQVIREKEHKL